MATKTRLSHSPPDLSDSERPTRRQKLESHAGKTLSPTRHPEFFKEDGDCYLQAENVIFKIHRHHLLRGGDSIFKDMFLLPPGDHASQGSTETDPIFQAGDTAERFARFLSIAYKELLDFQIEDMDEDDVPTLIECAYFAHKYTITPLLLACLRAIVHIAEVFYAEPEVAESIMALQALCEADVDDTRHSTSALEIASAVESGWISQIDSSSDFYILAEAMDFGEDHDLPMLLAHGAAFFLEKLSTHPDDTTPCGALFPFQDHDYLRCSHRRLIMGGAWSLEQLWTRFASKIPPFPMGVECSKSPYSHRTCVSKWEEDWRNALSSKAVQGISCGDMAKKLLTFENELQPAFEAGCSKKAFNNINPVAALRKIFNRYDHFLDS
ncbi:hypothetical protein B0H19DRAFT_1183983 [Mycena capillaripes]|nr:hypothetical protein B0H19DRAFT_1183983 [Mycena capillaripes]